jgi:urea carboxylase
MEGPGGYQFVGRTCQMWNRFRQTADFGEGKPWLLRFFDQIRFYPVTENELLDFRAQFSRGRVKLRVEPTTFKFADYRAFLRTNEAAIGAFKQHQQAAFDAERERWARLPPPPDTEITPVGEAAADGGVDLGPDDIAVRSDVTASVWQVLVEPGARVATGDRLAILESMKMEIPVLSPAAGTVRTLLVRPGNLVTAGQILTVLDTSA